MNAELLPLRVVNACNTSDSTTIEHIRSCLARGLPAMQPHQPPKDRPLVILASGPSGPAALDSIQNSGYEFDLMALNGAYNVALAGGHVPTYYAQLDARAVNVNFLADPRKETKFLLASQVHPDVFEAVADYDVTVFHLNTPACRETVPPPAVFFGGNAGTIGSSALALACELGYRHLILLGYDSSLARNGASHSRYQPQNADQLLLDVWLDDRQYWTTPALADQVMTFFEWTNVLHETYPGLVIDGKGEGLFYDWIANNQNLPAESTAAEAAKYQDAYKDPGYRMSVHRRALVRDVLNACKGRSLLDVGTGRGETLIEGREAGFTLVHGTETVPALLTKDVVLALLPTLPASDRAYDTVTCFEVLEHLLPKDVVPALKELARVAREWLVVSVCVNPDYVGGVNLHPSARSEEAWLQTFQEAGLPTPEFCGNASAHGASPVFRFKLA